MTCDLVIRVFYLFLGGLLALESIYACRKQTENTEAAMNMIFERHWKKEIVPLLIPSVAPTLTGVEGWTLIHQVYQGSQIIRYVGTRFKEGAGCSGWLRVPICFEYKIKWKGPLLALTGRKPCEDPVYWVYSSL